MRTVETSGMIPDAAVGPVGRVRSVPAALLTVLHPAVGMLYLGLPRLALLAFALNGCFAVALWLVPAALSSIAAVLGAGLVGGLGLAVWATFRARRHPAVARRHWRRWYGLIGAYIVAVGSMAWLGLPFHNYIISSGSMRPTLRIGEYVITERPERPAAAALEPGDVVMFPLPQAPDSDHVKRIVATAGHRVQMRGGVLHLDGVPVRRERLPSPAQNEDGAAEPTQIWRETLPNGRSYLTRGTDGRGLADNTEVVSVPPGQVFVLGDDRGNSLDSRFPADFGAVAVASIRFRAVAVYWSADGARIGTPLNR